MFGDDPNVDIPDAEKTGSFLHKPVGQRIWIVLAGPLMNLFFAAVLFGGVALVGERMLSPVVGDIEIGTVAYKAGFRSGDQIKTIDGQEMITWQEVEEYINEATGKTLKVALVRELTKEETTIDIQVSPKKNDNILSLKKSVGWVKGLKHTSEPPLIGVSNPESLAHKMGLRTGDLIQEVNGKEVTTWRAFSREMLNAKPGDLRLKIKTMAQIRQGKDKSDEEAKDEEVVVSGTLETEFASVKLKQVIEGDSPSELVDDTSEKTTHDMLADLGFERSETFIYRVSDEKPAAKAGLKVGDRIVSINDEKISRFENLLNTVKNYKSGQEPLQVTYKRDGEEKTVALVPELAQPDRNQGNFDDRFIIGISPIKSIAPPATFIWRTTNPFTVIAKGIEKSWYWTKLTLVSFVKLITNEVSPRNLGGFITIGQMAQKSWELGISQFLRIMAIISINLFIINLFPVPVLDGGHLLFFTIEALRGAPLSMRKLEIAQQIGLFLLLGLMGFALFNDVSRFFWN